jgi:release factor glutamine methyltransferase
VLIPRPETELLCEAVLERLPEGARVADVGTGSGCIAVTLALEWRTARVYAVDLSADALRIARRNAATHRADVGFVRADLLGSFAGASLDAVVSNPPYVPEPDRAGMAREVRDWEPETALFAGQEGMDIYRRLIPEAARVLRPGGLLAMEFGFGQAEAMRAMLAGWKHVEIRNDLAGIPRVALASVDL